MIFSTIATAISTLLLIVMQSLCGKYGILLDYMGLFIGLAIVCWAVFIICAVGTIIGHVAGLKKQQEQRQSKNYKYHKNH